MHVEPVRFNGGFCWLWRCEKEAAGSGEKVLRVGSSADFAPFEFQDVEGKEYAGFDMDLIRAVGKEMGYKVEIQNINLMV